MELRFVRQSVVVGLMVSLLLVAMAIAFGSKAFAEDYAALRQKWEDHLNGGDSLNTSDPDIALLISKVETTGQNNWSSLNTSGSRTYLWSDLADGASTNSEHIYDSYNRLREMALAYKMKGSSLRNNTTLKTDILSGLDWLYANWYNESEILYGNSWHWNIGVPLRMKDLLVLMYSDLSATQRGNYINAVDAFMEAETGAPVHQGANLTDVMSNHIVIGIVEENALRISNASAKLANVFPYVTSGDGFYTDGSFIQHDKVPYVGSYGNVALAGLADLFNLLEGSDSDFTDPGRSNVYRWVFDSFEPFLYKGSMMGSVRGRSIARPLQGDHIAGRAAIAQIAKLAQSAPPADAARMKSLVKYMIQEDTTLGNYVGMNMESVVLIKAIMADSGITARGQLIHHYEMPNQDRSVHFGNGYGFAVSKSSKRISTYELTNWENQKGWYTGDGMTYLYNNDQTQYTENFWATVNPYMLPGTTVDTRTRTWGFAQNGDGEGASTNSWSGGTTLGNYGSSGMELFAKGSTLTARKSWFMFDDEIVALGSGISSTDNRNIQTIVDQRKINSSGTNALTVNGTVKSTTLGWAETMSSTKWIHLQGIMTGADVGYVFLDSPVIKGIREARTGRWSDINNPTPASEVVTDNYVSLWYDHGANPTNADYGYIILPGKSSSQVNSYSSNKDIVLLRNDTSGQGAKETTLGVSGMNFWTNAAVTVGDVTSNEKASVVVKEVMGDTYEIAASDPTLENTGTITLEIDRQGLSVIAKDAAVTVNQLTPTIKITINVNGSNGKTFYAKFQLAPPINQMGVDGGAIFADNFNSQTAGTQPTGWTITNASGTSALIDATPSSTNKSVKLVDSNLSGQTKMQKSFPAQSDLVVAAWKFMEPASASNYPYFRLLNGTTIAISLNTGNGKLNYVSSTGVIQPVMSLSPNTWYTVKIVADLRKNTFDIYVNGVLKTVRASFNQAATSLNNIQFLSGYGAPSHSLYVDDISVRGGWTPLLDSDFNLEATGTKPLGWTITNDANTSSLIDETPSALNKSLKLLDTNTSGSSKAVYAFAPQAGGLIAQWRFMEPASASKYPDFQLVNGTVAATSLNTGGGSLNYVDHTGTKVVIQTVNESTWYTVKLVANIPANTYDIYVDGMLKATGVAFRNTAATIDGIYFKSGFGAAGTSILYIDDLLIHMNP
ncbi:MAG: hypothetical protein K0Q73_3444 [Paenibacillus sp.]|nr:hypothetical protein [Paenibacillus sp.]